MVGRLGWKKTSPVVPFVKVYLPKNKTTKCFNDSENEKTLLLRNDCSLVLISHFSSSPSSSLKQMKRLTLSRWEQTAAVPRVSALYTCFFLHQKHPSFPVLALKLLFCLPFGVATPLSSLLLQKVTVLTVCSEQSSVSGISLWICKSLFTCL